MQLWREHGSMLIKDQPARSCPACSLADSRMLFYSFDNYPYVDCLSCGTWYVPRVVDEHLFEQYYTACPEARDIMERFTQQRLDEQRAEADRTRMSVYFSELEPLLDSGLRSYLDVGCGVGHSLDVAAARGWRGCGLDSSQSIVQAGRQRGLRICHPDDIPEGEDFALISLWETLEHINEPFQLLSRLVPLLHEEGLMAITVPNALAIEARIMRQDLSWINGGAFGTVHINLFHPSSLGHLLSRVGLEIVGLDGEYSSNSYELASYFLGRHRGAWDYARGARVDQNLSEDTLCFLNWVGPAWNVLARQLLLTPVIKVIASKSRNVEYLTGVRTNYATARRAEIIADLDRMYPES